jgi:hypothetical protein
VPAVQKLAAAHKTDETDPSAILIPGGGVF